MAPRAGAASPGHRVVGEGREPGAGAVGHGAQYAVRRIRPRTHRHVKDSEKHVLARKALMQHVRYQELGKKLREILIRKIRSGASSHLHQYLYLLAHRLCVLVFVISCWLIC